MVLQHTKFHSDQLRHYIADEVIPDSLCTKKIICSDATSTLTTAKANNCLRITDVSSHTCGICQ